MGCGYYRILVCGSRDWEDKHFIENALYDMSSSEFRCNCNVTFIHGGCRGVDVLAGLAVHQINRDNTLEWKVEEYLADWKAHGRAAGPIRNREMLDTSPNFVMAFTDDLAASKGTKDCVFEAVRRGIEVRIYGHGEGK